MFVNIDYLNTSGTHHKNKLIILILILQQQAVRLKSLQSNENPFKGKTFTEC